MSGLTVGALMALALIQQTDTVLALDGATRLAVEAPGGSITVTAWDRPEVRIRATHSSRSFVEIRRRGSTIDVELEASRGPATIVDFRIDAPATLGLDLEGMYTQIVVEGMRGEVSAETFDNVRVVGGSDVKVSSVHGEVTVEGADGRVEVETVGKAARVADSAGEVYVESVGGGVTLENLRVRVVEAGSVGGAIRYSGTLQDGGRYYFGTHGGSVEIGVPENANATFNLATVHGGFTSDLAGAPERLARGRRTSFSVGSGSALVEVETFGGRISIVRR